MPIDMDNMLPGFSGQLISVRTAEISSNAGGGYYTMTHALLRDADILDVGIVVVGVGDGTDYTAEFRSTGSATQIYVAATTISGDEAIGTIFRVADGTMAWDSASDTEDERRLSRGDALEFGLGGTGSAGGKFVPFVLMRGAEPLDPIA